MLRILYLITQSELGGAQKYVYDLAKRLQGEFEIIVAFGEQGEKGELARLLLDSYVSTRVIPHLRREISLADDFKAYKEIKDLIKAEKPDIVHLNSSKISILGALAAKAVKIDGRRPKVVYTIHGWVFNEPLPPAKKLFYEFAENLTARKKDMLICVSEFDRQIGIAKGIAPAEKFTTIHNGVEPVDFIGRIEARNSLGISENGFAIVSIGNLYKTKGFEYLIDAAKLLIDNGMNLSLHIIGEGEERNRLEDWIKQNRLEKNIFLTGRINDAARLLPAFDAYVCSSVKEGLSYTVIEAMMAGLPIVATKVGGNPELIEDNATGLLVPAADPEALAKGIAQVAQNPLVAKAMGEAAKKKAADEFGFEKMVDETTKVYLERI